jgi:membrane-associated phospholipid phosphatase
MLTYLSIAQYRATLAAKDGKVRSLHPSTSAAVGGASAAVLSSFFPLDVASVEAQLRTDLAALEDEHNEDDDVAAGESIGRDVAADVLAQAATDNYFVRNPGVPPVGPGYWVSAAAPIVRGLYGARPFFLKTADQLRPPPPPTFGSPAFLSGLAEIRMISDTRTAEQTLIAQTYAWGTAPFTVGQLNLIVDQLIVDHHRSEREAARILAYANAATFDAGIACYDAKFAYWFIRPSQADRLITMPIALPNHPSYPSGHSCLTSALMTVAIDAFPSERERLETLITTTGLSRMYGGLHYRFDVEAGQVIGRSAAALALAGSLEGEKE